MANNETLDWEKLNVDMLPPKEKILYAGNEDKFTKLAFDVFRCNDTKIESLWILETDNDGKQYLVAKYEESEQPIEAKSNWVALQDSKGDITLAYKNVPLQKFAAQEYGFSKDDAHIFQRMLIEKLSTDKSFLEKFVKSISKESQEKLLSQFPELI